MKTLGIFGVMCLKQTDREDKFISSGDKNGHRNGVSHLVLSVNGMEFDRFI